ncbi:hypothetical protein POL68_28855 [Stigmatella sp. ncwal1]|uniref:4-hydroxybenzoate polyprenyltransferase n=1 Tax=Stigmatella ashevillensis TaxID=2995309 RepID=A0ABT5DFT7_9BACT|nr:hypothetical protein [Stigmatella ashevillena]MDC0712507.1 hypothetical protein [Stigmatella ashevillena]
MSRCRAVLRFSLDRYPPLFYGVGFVLWALGLDSVFLRLEGQDLTLSWNLLSVALSVAGVGYFMRIVDELRDYGYDRIHNPDRGLVRGDVSFGDLYGALTVCAVLLVGVNLPVSWPRALILLGIMGYSLLLWWLEQNSAVYQRSMFLSLGVAIQLHVGQGLYVWVSHAERTGRPLEGRGVLVVLGLVGIYLHWEVMRKTAWPGSTKPGEKLYSDEVGPVASGLIGFAWVAGAVGTLLGLTKPWRAETLSQGIAWLFLLPVVLGALNVGMFFKTRSPRSRSGRLAGISYLMFLLTVLLYGFTGSA